MKDPLRPVTEEIARKTTRRGFFGRGLDLVFGGLAGVAAGSLVRPDLASAGFGTICAFPGPACPCSGCNTTGVCAKPCIINTTWYASGCWITQSVTCCDCSCNGLEGIGTCGCGTDFHLDPGNCPDGLADS